jgi:hypothetical protein
VRVATDNRSIGGAGPDDPDGRDSVWRAIVEGRRQVGCLGGLAVRAPHGCAKIAERVPRLLDQENTVARVADADIDRSGRIRRARRQLEGPASAGCSREFEEALLHRQVPGISWFSSLAERPRERDRERTPKCDPERDPELERDRTASAELDPADPRLMDADARGQPSLCEMEAYACGPDGSPKRLGQGRRQARRLSDGFRGPLPRPCRGCHAWESYMRAFTATYAGAEALGTGG